MLRAPVPGPDRPGLDLPGLGVVVVAVVAIVGLVGFASMQNGPRWGLRLQATADGVVAGEVRANMVAWEQGLRPGERVLRVVDPEDRPFVGQSLGAADRIVFRDAAGNVRTATLPAYPPSVLGALYATALLFALLGAVVYRWTPERGLRIGFLSFCGSVALALAASPAAAYGYGWAFFLSGAAAIVAASGFTAFTLAFPRPVRRARLALYPLAVATAAFVGAIGMLVLAERPYPPAMNSGLFVWFAGSLIGGILILATRARNSADRRTFAPVALGTAVGFAPLVALNLVPFLLFRVMLVPAEVASIGAVAIPMGFAYAILRHRLFGLDALLRNALIYLCVAVTLLTAFGAPRQVVLFLGGGELPADILGALILAALAPRLGGWLGHVVDAHLYAGLALARTAGDRTTGAVPEIGRGIVRDARQVVPLRWATVVLRGARPAETFEPARRMRGRVAAVDGDVPTEGLPRGWRGDRPEFEAGGEGRTVVPIRRGPTVLGALVVGPRLDGTPLTGIDREALNLLVERAAVPLEAALLHELTDDETRYRDGLASFARDLAAAGSVDDVLAITAQHARSLIPSDRSGLWLRAPDGAFTPAAGAWAHCDLGDPTPIADLADVPTPVTLHNPGSQRPCDEESPSRMLYRLGSPGSVEAVGVLLRDAEFAAFGPEEERRMAEVVEYANGALGRAHALAAAAEAETLREINRFRADFLDVVSHDLQNPLAVIRGFAELLQMRADTVDPDFLRDATDSILGSYRSCQRLIDDLLTTARIEKGRLTLSVENVDVTRLLLDLTGGYQVLPGGDRVVFVDGPPLQIRADRARVEQMVGNLVTNALRYARTGPIIVRARPGPNREVWIEVTDHGPGIAPADQGRVWEKFYRTKGGERATTRGTGVGLSVVRTLAELHGGRAELESVPGQGSTFRIVLPAAGPASAGDAPVRQSRGRVVAA